MLSISPLKRRHFTEAARTAALAARKAKMARAESFGAPELFVVKAGERTYAWELRRFGGIVLQRGSDTHASAALARADGAEALSALLAMSDLPRFARQDGSRRSAEDRNSR